MKSLGCAPQPRKIFHSLKESTCLPGRLHSQTAARQPRHDTVLPPIHTKSHFGAALHVHTVRRHARKRLWYACCRCTQAVCKGGKGTWRRLYALCRMGRKLSSLTHKPSLSLSNTQDVRCPALQHLPSTHTRHIPNTRLPASTTRLTNPCRSTRCLTDNRLRVRPLSQERPAVRTHCTTRFTWAAGTVRGPVHAELQPTRTRLKKG